MPFDKNNPPAKVRGLSDKKQRQWVEVFNSCYGKHKDDEKCHKMAWGAVKTAHMQERIARMTDKVAATSVEAGGFLDDVKAMKMKARALDFFQAVKDFRGATNVFLKEMTSAVKDPRALQEFPEIRDVIELGEFMKKGVLRHTFLSDADLSQKMQRVVEADA